MSFEKIESVIIAEAEAEAKRIRESARQESEEMISRSREENERVFAEAGRQAEAAAARETSRQVGSARHEGRLQVLDAKNRVIDDIFRKAAERVLSLPDKEYLELMSDWVRTLPAEVGGTLRVGPRDEKRFTKALLDEVNKDRSGSGKFNAVEVDPQITGGFMVAGENFTVNATVENKVNELRDALAGDLAKELFGS